MVPDPRPPSVTGQGEADGAGRSVPARVRIGAIVATLLVTASVLAGVGAGIEATGAADTATVASGSALLVESVPGVWVGGTVTVEVVVTSLPQGYSGADFLITLGDPTTARIVGATATAGSLPIGEVRSDREAFIKNVDLDRTIQPGAENVTLARITLEGVSDGTIRLDVTALNLDSEDGPNFVPSTTRSGHVRVYGPPGPNGTAPTDPDGDGRFEDVSGDGATDYADVVALFEGFGHSTYARHPEAFDFNGNGRLDFGDVIALFRAH
jgi:PKD repeat protein